MHLVQVDVVGAQAPETCLAAADDVMTRQPLHVLALAHREPHLGGDQEVVAASLERLSEDLLRAPV